MDENKLKKITLDCVIGRVYARTTKEGKTYCILFQPSNQAESFECPLLSPRRVGVYKGNWLFGGIVDYYTCIFDRLSLRQLRYVQEKIQDSMDGDEE